MGRLTRTHEFISYPSRRFLRGVESFGMICSESELGMAEDSEGISELDADAPIGKNPERMSLSAIHRGVLSVLSIPEILLVKYLGQAVVLLTLDLTLEASCAKTLMLGILKCQI
jgi:hypothetical protein